MKDAEDSSFEGLQVRRKPYPLYINVALQSRSSVPGLGQNRYRYIGLKPKTSQVKALRGLINGSLNVSNPLVGEL